jgi:hypothetical protein
MPVKVVSKSTTSIPCPFTSRRKAPNPPGTIYTLGTITHAELAKPGD